MAETYRGACLCGEVEYELRDPEGLGYCHCSRCQRWTGSSLAGVVVAADNFHFTRGEDLVSTYESDFAPRNFCSNCGSSIYDDLGGKYFVAAGLMRELDLEPAFHLQVAYKAPWHEIGDSAPQYAENPPA
ncbi:MAG: GFA family protein [Solirubrobacterales bacterium]